jgi:hypothetical protein
MLTVTGKIQAANKSSTGKSYSINVGGTWVHVAADDLDTFKNVVGKGEPVEVRGRTELILNEDGTPKMRTFKKRDGSQGTGPEISLRYWFVGAGADNNLSDLLGIEAKAGTTEA